jgi:two-component system phosphate regulon sensor histidine kinase PhoR
MYNRPVPLSRLGAITLAVTAPAAAALVALVAWDRLNPWPALAAYGGVVVLTAVLLRPILKEIATVSGWARALAAGADAAPPELRGGILDDIVAAIIQQRRAMRGRQGDLSALAQWNESLFDNLPDPLVLLDRQRRVMRMNKTAREVLGRESGGRDLAVVLRDPAVLEAVDAVLAGETGCEADLTLRAPAERTFRVRVERLHDSAVESSVAILALHDLTAVKRLEQMRADFVANASHELRTPLATLLGFIETLRGAARDDAEARERFLVIMHDQAERMSRLVNDLLSLSRVELNERTRPTAMIDLGALIERGAAAMQPLVAAKSMRLTLDLAPAARLCPGQADELAQVVQNLMDNAVKYGRAGTEVAISLKAADTPPAGAGAELTDGPALVLAVADRGDGIAKEHLPRLTERFYRVDTARSRSLGGTGLGLAIVKHIVNRHRGMLAIESTVGQGTTVSVYLPG